MKNISTKTLYTYLRNALKTGVCCSGHTKSHWNFVKANEYRDILNERGENLPSHDLAALSPRDPVWYDAQLKLGKYNGSGSF